MAPTSMSPVNEKLSQARGVHSGVQLITTTSILPMIIMIMIMIVGIQGLGLGLGLG